MISILPASILEKSRISFTRDRRVLPDTRIFSAYSSICCSDASLRIISSIPRTAFMGVRIS